MRIHQAGTIYALNEDENDTFYLHAISSAHKTVRAMNKMTKTRIRKVREKREVSREETVAVVDTRERETETEVETVKPGVVDQVQRFLSPEEEKAIIRAVQGGAVPAFEDLVNAYKQKAY